MRTKLGRAMGNVVIIGALIVSLLPEMLAEAWRALTCPACRRRLAEELSNCPEHPREPAGERRR